MESDNIYSQLFSATPRLVPILRYEEIGMGKLTHRIDCYIFYYSGSTLIAFHNKE